MAIRRTGGAIHPAPFSLFRETAKRRGLLNTWLLMLPAVRDLKASLIKAHRPLAYHVRTPVGQRSISISCRGEHQSGQLFSVKHIRQCWLEYIASRRFGENRHDYERGVCYYGCIRSVILWTRKSKHVAKKQYLSSSSSTAALSFNIFRSYYK